MSNHSLLQGHAIDSSLKKVLVVVLKHTKSLASLMLPTGTPKNVPQHGTEILSMTCIDKIHGNTTHSKQKMGEGAEGATIHVGVLVIFIFSNV